MFNTSVYEKTSRVFSSNVRLSKRFLVAILSAICIAVIYIALLSPSSRGWESQCTDNRWTTTNPAEMEAAFLVPSQFTFLNLNTLNATTHPKERREHILILTPLKNASPYLGRHFELLDRLSYPKELISIAFLVSDTTDDTVQMLKEYADIFLNRPNHADRFHRIQVFEKDFHYELPEDKRHTYALQPLRRSVMARSRNYLLNTALNEEHSWVLWLDVDIVDYPETVLEDLMSVNVDVVVPNCLLKREDGQFWGYDKNNWQETEESLALQKDLDPDFVFLEGYWEFVTHRLLLIDMPTHLGKFAKFPLDGVGGTFTLVKAQVHREGANFPAYPFQHQMETEGFAKMAKAMGFGVYGLPGYMVYHTTNSS